LNKTVFNNTWLRSIHQIDLSNGEFYLVKKKNTSANGIAWFSGDDKRKLGLLIKFYDDKKDFHLCIDCNIKAGKNAHHFRRAGNTIEADIYLYSIFSPATADRTAMST
jgi:hypothetical protein